MRLTPFDPDYLENPYSVLRQIREADPLHHDLELHRYFPTRYEDVRAILKDPDLLTDPNSSLPESYARHFINKEDEEVSMLLADGHRHRRLRQLVNDLFKPRAVEGWRERVEDVVRHYLDRIEGPEFDLMAAFAEPVPTVVIAEIMGIPSDKQADFKRWSEMTQEAAFNPVPSEEALKSAAKGAEQLESFFLKEIATRRQHPLDDLISQLIASEIDGDKLSDGEIVSQCVLLLLAGNLTTTDMIGNGVRALLENPAQLKKLRENNNLIEATIEEVLRYDAPVLNSSRITHQDTEISGCPIRRGECLHVSLASANRDPAVYQDPDLFDIERTPIPHLAFGGGRHFCLGAHLARLEGQIAILRLVQRFPKLRFAERGYVQSFVPEFRGLEYCWLRID